jgi:Protein of unknown function (DUF565)
MQNTRLNSLVDRLLDRFATWIQNPWRRTSLLIISLLFGNFLATAIATVTGQSADWDVVVAAVLTGLTEVASWLIYGMNRRVPAGEPKQRPLGGDILNALKLGLIYGLFVEAFKIGS